MNETGLQSQLRALMYVLTQPAGLLGIACLILLAFGQLSSKSLKWLVLAVALWVSSMAFSVEVADRRPIQLVEPLESVRSQARPICGALLIVLFVSVITSHRGWRRRIVGWPTLTLFFFQIVFSLRVMATDVSVRGQLSLFIFLMLFVLLGVGLGRWLQDWRDAHAALRAIAFAALLFLLGTSYQLLFNRASIVRGNRLSATAGNPQQTGILIATALPTLCYFVIRKAEPKLSRIIQGAAIGFLLIFLVWTGSRTGMLMAASGIVLFFRARIGKILLISLLSGIFVYLAMQIYNESTLAFTEMFLRGDTRSQVWSSMWQNFLEHKLWGGMAEEFGVGENSYLAVASNLGLVGLVPMCVFLIATAWNLFRLARVRKFLGEQVLLADACTATLIALAVGAMFEAYLMGTLSFAVMCCYIFLSIITFILDAVAVSALQPQLPAEGYEEEHHEYEPATGNEAAALR